MEYKEKTILKNPCTTLLEKKKKKKMDTMYQVFIPVGD